MERGTSPRTNNPQAQKQLTSFEDGVQLARAYLEGIHEFAVASGQNDLDKARSAWVQVVDRPFDLIGSDVIDEDGQAIAEMDGFAIHNQDDSLHAILRVGGFLGISTETALVSLDNLHMNEHRQLVLTKVNEEELAYQNPNKMIDYRAIDVSDIAQRGTITTIPTSGSLAYLFAASNSQGVQEEFSALVKKVNQYHSLITTCLYEFYSGLSVQEYRDDQFSCANKKNDRELDISIGLDESRYRLVLFR